MIRVIIVVSISVCDSQYSGVPTELITKSVLQDGVVKSLCVAVLLSGKPLSLKKNKLLLSKLAKRLLINTKPQSETFSWQFGVKTRTYLFYKRRQSSELHTAKPGN